MLIRYQMSWQAKTENARAENEHTQNPTKTVSMLITATEQKCVSQPIPICVELLLLCSVSEYFQTFKSVLCWVRHQFKV